MLPVEQLASAAKIERIDIHIDRCKKPHVLPGPPRRERDGLLRANQVCQRCSPSRTPRCTSISSLGFGVGGLQVHALLLQMVPGELNDKLITSDAMRRKSAHGIALVLQKCCLHVRTRARMHAHVHMDERACMFMCACPCVYMYMYMCMCTCMYVRMKVDACAGQRLWLAQLGQQAWLA